MNNIHKKLIKLAETPSDIREHLFTLFGYSVGNNHITEMGVRSVVSTWAFLAAKPTTLVCIDINYSPYFKEAETLAKEYNIDLKFLLQNTIEPGFEIEQTDVLFIDTLHTYPQLKQELFQHSHKVNNYIILHDTTTFGLQNESNIVSNPQGLQAAVLEFIEKDQNWEIANIYENCNGLAILKRI